METINLFFVSFNCWRYAVSGTVILLINLGGEGALFEFILLVSLCEVSIFIPLLHHIEIVDYLFYLFRLGHSRNVTRKISFLQRYLRDDFILLQFPPVQDVMMAQLRHCHFLVPQGALAIVQVSA